MFVPALAEPPAPLSLTLSLAAQRSLLSLVSRHKSLSRGAALRSTSSSPGLRLRSMCLYLFFAETQRVESWGGERCVLLLWLLALELDP